MYVTPTSPHVKETRIHGGSEGNVSALMMRYQRELAADPELVERILETLPAAPPEPEHVTVRTDPASVDIAIGRSLALAVAGIESRLKVQK
jgi:hypothetical protein